MHITRENIDLPMPLRVAICGHRPSEGEWRHRIGESLFGEAEWKPVLGIGKAGIRKLIDQHCLPIPESDVVCTEKIEGEERTEWNSIEDIWRECSKERGTFLGSRVFTPECQVVLYWDKRFHNGKRSYPIPICFNPTLLKIQRMIDRTKRVSLIRPGVADVRWHGQYFVLPSPPDTDSEVRAEYLRFYGFDEAFKCTDLVLLVTTKVVMIRSVNARIKLLIWTRAQLVSDPFDFVNNMIRDDETVKTNPIAGKLGQYIA